MAKNITVGTQVSTSRWGNPTRDRGTVRKVSADGKWVYVKLAGTMVEEELSISEVTVV